MSDDQPRSQRPGPDAAPPPESESPSEERSLSEKQAIAAALMIGEQMRREGKGQLYFYVKRIGLFSAVLSFLGMIILFAYSRLSQGEFNPIFGILLLAVVMAGSTSAAYWAYAEDRRSKEE